MSLGVSYPSRWRRPDYGVILVHALSYRERGQAFDNS